MQRVAGLALIAAAAISVGACSSGSGERVGTSGDALMTCVPRAARRLCFEDRHGWAITQGDILLGRVSDVLSGREPGGPRARAEGGLKTESFFANNPGLWANRTIPFVIEGGFQQGGIDEILSAMQEWHDRGGFTFVQRTSEPDYVTFHPQDGAGCYSYIGRVGGAQPIQVVPAGNCAVVHEIGHAIGLLHEQSRPDRDNYVTIHYENMDAQWKPQFDITDGNASLAYDITSVMHYPWNAFSNNGQPTITRKDGSTTGLDYKWHLSDGDVQAANAIYGGGAGGADPLSFDAGYYLAFYSDLRSAFGSNQAAATQHWLSNGIHEGRQGSPLVASQFYLSVYPDLRSAFGNDYGAALQHWSHNGVAEGRDGSPVFNAAYYLAAYGDLRNAFGGDRAAAAKHFLQSGIAEGRHASPFFDVAFYLSMYDDLRNAFGSNHSAALTHFVTNGEAEGRMGTIAFDPSFYLSTYGDLQSAFGTDKAAALRHWVTYGIQEGRAGSPVFDSGYYLAHYSDLQRAFGSNRRAALEHYLLNGINEGRQAAAGFDPKYYLIANLDVAAACGGPTAYACGALHYLKSGRAQGRRGAP